MFRKRHSVAPYFRMPNPSNPITGDASYTFPPKKPYVRFVLTEAMTTSDAVKDASITDADQWGPAPIYHCPNLVIHVHNQETKVAGVYQFRGQIGDVGIALWDTNMEWRIISMIQGDWMLGKISGGNIASEATGTVTRYNQLWVITDPAEEYTVLNPHDIELPNGLKVRWTSYPGWTNLVVEPFDYTEC